MQSSSFLTRENADVSEGYLWGAGVRHSKLIPACFALVNSVASSLGCFLASLSRSRSRSSSSRTPPQPRHAVHDARIVDVLALSRTRCFKSMPRSERPRTLEQSQWATPPSPIDRDRRADVMQMLPVLVSAASDPRGIFGACGNIKSC